MQQKKSIFRIILKLLAAFILTIVVYYFFPESKLPAGSKVDKILVEKSKRKMLVYSGGKKLKTYSVSLGFRPRGKKRFEGDGRTPEGIYYIVSKNSRSIAHKSLGLSYPNAADRKYAAQRDKSAGAHIMIHGMMNGFGYWGKFHRFIDWTAGCIAVTNSEMDDLFRHVDVGCEVEIIE
jgi:murein L,D-transpeptidase YafK